MQFKHLLTVSLFSSLIAGAHAANPVLTSAYNPTFTSASGLGTTILTDSFININSAAHPGYPGISGSQVWPASIGADSPSGSLAFFQKQAGFDTETTDFLGGASGGGIYSFFSNTHLEISVGAALAQVSSVRLELSIALGGTGQDVIAAPTLTLNTTSGSFTLTPTTSGLLGATPVNVFGSDTNINLEGYTWDVSSFTGTINSFKVDWQVDQHSISYGGQISQGAATTVPEPSSSMLFAMSATAGVLHSRRRARRVN
jgi:hypothetical protein